MKATDRAFNVMSGVGRGGKHGKRSPIDLWWSLVDPPNPLRFVLADPPNPLRFVL